MKMHGQRKVAINCSCICCKDLKNGKKPTPTLESWWSTKELKRWMGKERFDGLDLGTDRLNSYDADFYAMKFCYKHPNEIWPGWLAAGEFESEYVQ